ncbi:hypothetical protein DID99_35360 [Burkholderia sp. Bp8986]|nr:hypothetical protein DID99_35360 [Burkholderia sp. Bp8986]
MLPSDKQRAKLMAEFACDIKHLPATARGEAFAHWINAAAELRLTPAQHCDVLKTIIDRIDDLPDDAREAAFMQLLGNIEAQSSFAQQATLLNILIDWISDLPDSARSRAFTRLEGSINALPLKFGYELLPGLAREVWEVPVGARGPALAYLVSKIVMLAPEEQATLMEELEEQLELEESPYREQSAAFAFLVDISLPPQLRANVLCDLTGQVVNLTNLTPKERLAARKHLFLTIATLPPELQEKPLEALRQSAPAPITTKLPEATSRIRTVG